jgi:hypothetical protein
VRGVRATVPGCQQLIALLINDPALSYAQISARLDIPVASIGPNRRRCLDKLRRHPAIAALINADAQTATSHAYSQRNAEEASPPSHAFLACPAMKTAAYHHPPGRAEFPHLHAQRDDHCRANLRTDRRVGARLLRDLRAFGPLAGPGCDGQPAVYLCIAALEVNVLNCRRQGLPDCHSAGTSARGCMPHGVRHP